MRSAHANSQAASIFGSAKPREAVLAERAGLDEKEVVAKEAAATELKIRLTPEQIRTKRDAEAVIEALREQATQAEDEESKGNLEAEADAKQAELDELVRGFEEMAVQNAKEGRYQVRHSSI